MHPILFSIGSLHIYSLSIFIILAWLIFSFLFWRYLRSIGAAEDKIFDLTFYATLAAFIVSRALFVLLHWELFSDSLLKIPAIWIQPGFSLYGAFLGGLVTCISMSRSAKIRSGHILDAVAVSFPFAIIIGLVGVFLDGSVPGKVALLPWALPVVGLVGKRHPVQIYEIIVIFLTIFLLWRLQLRGIRLKWPYGKLGIWFFILYSISEFVLEFFKDTRVYWISLSANQWMLIAIFAEALGAFYVRGGGREAIRPIFHKLRYTIKRS